MVRKTEEIFRERGAFRVWERGGASLASERLFMLVWGIFQAGGRAFVWFFEE